MRIVLDTNVLIAAFITRGVCSDVFEHCVRRHTLITSEAILSEFRRNMIVKFGYGSAEIDESVELLQSKMEIVRPTPLETVVCRDPDDNMVLGTAIAGNANCIITGDTDLLIIGKYLGVGILRPAEFVEYETSHLTGGA